MSIYFLGTTPDAPHLEISQQGPLPTTKDIRDSVKLWVDESKPCKNDRVSLYRAWLLRTCQHKQEEGSATRGILDYLHILSFRCDFSVFTTGKSRYTYPYLVCAKCFKNKQFSMERWFGKFAPSLWTAKHGRSQSWQLCNPRLSSLESAWLVLKPKMTGVFDMEFLWPKAVAQRMLDFLLL